VKRIPLDLHLADRTGLVRVARLFSNIVSPPVLGATLGLAAGLHALPTWRGLVWAVLYGLLVSLAPILFVLFLLKTGRVQELHMTNKRERYVPYLVGILSSAIVYGLVKWGGGPNVIGCLALFNSVQLAALGLVNFYWLISFHASAMSATALLSVLIFGRWTLLLTAPLLLTVAMVRLYLRRHTPAQIVAGILLGILVVYGLVASGCKFS